MNMILTTQISKFKLGMKIKHKRMNGNNIFKKPKTTLIFKLIVLIRKWMKW